MKLLSGQFKIKYKSINVKLMTYDSTSDTMSWFWLLLFFFSWNCPWYGLPWDYI